MRITGGKARGIQLKAPPGKENRPSTDRVRESVFASIGPAIEGAKVVDLFAGTGAYGLEAFSRGANNVSFFENNPKALQCLKQNQVAVAKSCQRSLSELSTVSRDLFLSAKNTGPYDYIFIDPPYSEISTIIEKLFSEVIDHIAGEDTTVLFELPGNLEPSLPNWQFIRRLGKAKRDHPSIAIFRRKNI